MVSSRKHLQQVLNSLVLSLETATSEGSKNEKSGSEDSLRTTSAVSSLGPRPRWGQLAGPVSIAPPDLCRELRSATAPYVPRWAQAKPAAR